MGEDVGRYGGAFAVSHGLLEEFGPERVRDTPLSESAFVGAGIGAALAGMRPIVEMMTVNFSLLALDQIVNNAATLRHMSGGQIERAARRPHGDRRRPAARGPALAQPRGAGTRTSPGSGSLAPATVADARGHAAGGARASPTRSSSSSTRRSTRSRARSTTPVARDRTAAVRRDGRTSRSSPTAARSGRRSRRPSGSPTEASRRR